MSLSLLLAVNSHLSEIRIPSMEMTIPSLLDASLSQSSKKLSYKSTLLRELSNLSNRTIFQLKCSNSSSSNIHNSNSLQLKILTDLEQKSRMKLKCKDNSNWCSPELSLHPRRPRPSGPTRSSQTPWTLRKVIEPMLSTSWSRTHRAEWIWWMSQAWLKLDTPASCRDTKSKLTKCIRISM